MGDDKNFSELGKQLAELGIAFDDVKSRVKEMPEDKKRNIFIGFANQIINEKPEEAFLAAKEANDTVLVRSSARKLLEVNLRLASRVATASEDEDLMELVIEEATKRNDAAMVEMMKRQLKEKRLKALSKQFGI